MPQTLTFQVVRFSGMLSDNFRLAFLVRLERADPQRRVGEIRAHGRLHHYGLDGRREVADERAPDRSRRCRVCAAVALSPAVELPTRVQSKIDVAAVASDATRKHQYPASMIDSLGRHFRSTRSRFDSATGSWLRVHRQKKALISRRSSRRKCIPRALS